MDTTTIYNFVTTSITNCINICIPQIKLKKSNLQKISSKDKLYVTMKPSFTHAHLSQIGHANLDKESLNHD